MGVVHEQAELLQVVVLQHLNGVEDTLILFHNMAGAASDGFVSNFILMEFELFRLKLCQIG
ncbi:hypothetical protein D3C74_374190 [compost metagenome]